MSESDRTAADWRMGDHFVWIEGAGDSTLSAELDGGWHDVGSRDARTTWVARWLTKDNTMVRRPLDAPAVPASTEPLRATVVSAALAAFDQGAQERGPLAPFAIPATTLATDEGLANRIELTSLALQDAAGRVGEAARNPESWAGNVLVIRITEWLAWIRAFDELLAYTWTRKLSRATREEACARAERSISRYAEDSHDLLITEEERDRRDKGRPYHDWTVALLAGGTPMPRRDLDALRWLAGKMLHHGPLPAVHLEQREPGYAPYWVWRAPDEICPPTEKESRPDQRAAYMQLAGRPLGQSLHTGQMAMKAEIQFLGMLARDREQRVPEGRA